MLKALHSLGAPIAKWIHLHRPSCCPRFESHAQHLHFFHLLVLNEVFKKLGFKFGLMMKLCWDSQILAFQGLESPSWPMPCSHYAPCTQKVGLPRTFLLSRINSVPNFIMICPAVWISIENIQTNKHTNQHCPLRIRFVLHFLKGQK